MVGRDSLQSEGSFGVGCACVGSWPFVGGDSWEGRRACWQVEGEGIVMVVWMIWVCVVVRLVFAVSSGSIFVVLLDLVRPIDRSTQVYHNPQESHPSVQLALLSSPPPHASVSAISV